MTTFSINKTAYLPPVAEGFIVETELSFLYSGGTPEGLTSVEVLNDDDFNY